MHFHFFSTAKCLVHTRTSDPKDNCRVFNDCSPLVRPELTKKSSGMLCRGNLPWYDHVLEYLSHSIKLAAAGTGRSCRKLGNIPSFPIFSTDAHWCIRRLARYVYLCFVWIFFAFFLFLFFLDTARLPSLSVYSLWQISLSCSNALSLSIRERTIEGFT